MEPASYPAAATITAAIIAGGIAYLSSVLSKEQKTSEFRYSWLNAVLDDIAKFAGAVESVSSAALSIQIDGNEKPLSFLASAEPQIREALAAYYRARIRLYPEDHKQVISALDELQVLLMGGQVPDRAKMDSLIRELVKVSHAALKNEWGRVKRGETTFVVTKYVSLTIFSVAALFAIFALFRPLT